MCAHKYLQYAVLHRRQVFTGCMGSALTWLLHVFRSSQQPTRMPVVWKTSMRKRQYKSCATNTECVIAYVALQAVGASTRVFALLDRQPQMVPAGQAKPRGSPEGAHIEFRNVTFAYPSRPDIQVSALWNAADASMCCGDGHVFSQYTDDMMHTPCSDCSPRLVTACSIMLVLKELFCLPLHVRHSAHAALSLPTYLHALVIV